MRSPDQAEQVAGGRAGSAPQQPEATSAPPSGHTEEGRRDRIQLSGGDDAVTRIQLAARWAEAYAPAQGDTFRGALQRFRVAFEYLDAVTHGVEPPTLDSER